MIPEKTWACSVSINMTAYKYDKGFKQKQGNTKNGAKVIRYIIFYKLYFPERNIMKAKKSLGLKFTLHST